MPHKSKHKHYRTEPKLPAAPVTGQTPAPGVQMSKAPAAPVRPAARPKTGAPAQSLAAIGATRYPFLTSEMKWIGIFAGIIVVLIVILAIVVPRLVS